eukprot:198199_1
MSDRTQIVKETVQIETTLTNLNLSQEYIDKFNEEQITDEETLLMITYDQLRDEMKIPVQDRATLSEYIRGNRSTMSSETDARNQSLTKIDDILNALHLTTCNELKTYLEGHDITTKEELKRQVTYRKLRPPDGDAVKIPLGPTVKIIDYIQTCDANKTRECDICGSVWDIICKSISKNIKTADDDEQIEFWDHCRNCCHFGEEFDVYQVLAFESTLVERDIVTLWQYRLKCLKGFLCSITQVFGIIVVLYQLLSDGMDNKGICNEFDTNTAHMNILAFCLSTYLSYTTVKQLSAKKGLYQYIPLRGYDVTWLDHGWLYYGFVVNTVASICAVWGSFGIIFYSENAIDMVLNSVALFFLVELDDLLVNDEDYEEFEKSMNEFFIGRDKNKGFIKDKLGRCGDWVGATIFWVIGAPFELLRFITIVACVTVPFYIVVCF